MVAFIAEPGPLNMHCFLEPFVKEVRMYGPLKRDDEDHVNKYIERLHATKRKHTLRVTRVVTLDESNDEA